MIIKAKFLLVAACFALVSPVGGSASAQIAGKTGVRTIVIDAGHGGADPGAVYGGVKEKDVNLDVALRLGALIEASCPDVKVVYTRQKDVAVGLAERGDIANKAGADLFISIHSDAIENHSVRGATTYIMGMDKQDKNLVEAMRENAVMKYEDDYSEKYEGFNPTSAESYIIFSLMQHADFDQSLLLAQKIQKQYKTATAIADRGAKQGPFYVLWKPAMPRVLTELGFLSNQQDRQYLASTKGKDAMAKALHTAFVDYKTTIETPPSGVLLAQADKTEPAPAKVEPKKVEPKPATAPAKVEPKKVEPKPAPKPATEPAKVEPKKVEPKPEPKPETKPATAPTTAPQFYVQLLASHTKSAVDNQKIFGAYAGKVVERRVGEWYKYYLGGFAQLAEANAAMAKASAAGFKGAFVIALDGDTQISVAEANRRIQRNK
ncbi:MAG: N-acetylmuramoyl-L-alanine amidase [Rikenellaceae bacterium]|jgi:N-acetylmuramoyl-L-alanine amidase|nr:N-acetylmuramoyl-L-alanine amidase [Rikenellaceae bacterium]